MRIGYLYLRGQVRLHLCPQSFFGMGGLVLIPMSKKALSGSGTSASCEKQATQKIATSQRIILDTTMKSSLSFLIAALVVSFMGAVGAAAQGGRLCGEACAAWQTFGDGYYE